MKMLHCRVVGRSYLQQAAYQVTIKRRLMLSLAIVHVLCYEDLLVHGRVDGVSVLFAQT